jgi:hypothetical protein
MGLGYDEITAALLNPATLTNCVYLSNWRDSPTLFVFPASISK